jgi:hypothetical protein
MTDMSLVKRIKNSNGRRKPVFDPQVLQHYRKNAFLKAKKAYMKERDAAKAAMVVQ